NGRQGAGTGQHTIELATAVVGDHDAIGAKADRIARVVRVKNALDHHGAIPELAGPFQVLPADRRVEVGAQPADVVGQPGGVAAVGGNVAQVMGAAQQPA